MMKMEKVSPEGVGKTVVSSKLREKTLTRYLLCLIWPGLARFGAQVKLTIKTQNADRSTFPEVHFQ